MRTFAPDEYDQTMYRAWEAKGKTLPILINDPITVAVYSCADLVLQHYVTLKGESAQAHNDLLYRKAEVVKWTGLRYREALVYAQNDGVELLGDWLPAGKGTNYEGAAPVIVDGRLTHIVSVSGQDHRLFDQPFADAIAEELEKLS